MHRDEFLNGLPIDLEKATDGIVRSSSVSLKNTQSNRREEKHVGASQGSSPPKEDAGRRSELNKDILETDSNA